MLDAFLAFWRRHGQPLLASAPYHEIAPHLVRMAFLHRVANGEGTLEREYAIGAGRADAGPMTLKSPSRLTSPSLRTTAWPSRSRMMVTISE